LLIDIRAVFGYIDTQARRMKSFALKTDRTEDIMMKKIGAILGVLILLVMAACEQSTGSGRKSGDTLPAEAYAISLNRSGTHKFPVGDGTGYTPPAPLAVVITNEGSKATGDLSIALSGDVRAFTLSDTVISGIQVKGTVGFTVAPVAGLALGPYTAQVTVSGAASGSDTGSDTGIAPQSFDVRFTVVPHSSTTVYSIALSETGTYVFPSASLGYTQVAARSVSVINTGNQPTGGLTVSVSDTDSWTLSPVTLGSIAVGETGSFTIAPATGLSQKTHDATVTVSGASVASKSFNISFTVNPDSSNPVYRIDLSETGTYVFPSANENYASVAARTVTVTNTGNRATGGLSVSVSDPALFALLPGTLGSIEPGKKETFTITPATRLGHQTYHATVTVSGGGSIGIAPKSFNVSFTVNPAGGAPVYGIGLSETGTYVFPSATEGEGYGEDKARNITVTNTGNQPTGELKIDVSTDSFALSPGTLGSIAAGGTGSFTISPAGGLEAQTYHAQVRVSGAASGSNNGIASQMFNVSFTVNPDGAVYSIALSETGTYVFPQANKDYAEGDVEVKPITVTNTGTRATGELRVSVSDPASWTLSQGTLESIIEPGGQGTFTITPATGLSHKTHNAVVTVASVSNSSAIAPKNFNISFTVKTVASHGISLWETEGEPLDDTLTFKSEAPGYEPPITRIIYVENIGSQQTGELGISVSDTTSWVLSTETETKPGKIRLPGIPAGETDSFTIRPATNLPPNTYTAKTYNATVTIGGYTVPAQSFNVSFTVLPATYGISLGELGETGTYTFPPASLGYGYDEAFAEVSAKIVEVSNTGNQPTDGLTVALTGAATEAFTLSPATGMLPSIPAGGNGCFTIRPNSGITAVGTYTATVTVSDGHRISANFDVSFEVYDPLDTGWRSVSAALAYLDTASGGTGADNPVTLKMDVDLASETDSYDALLEGLDERQKYVALDLASCRMDGTTFGLYNGPDDCKKYITSLVLPDGAESVTGLTLGAGLPPQPYTKLLSVSGAGVTSLGNYAFDNCTSLASVDFPELTSLGVMAFAGCSALEEVDFPKVTSISTEAFGGCSALEEADFPELTSVTSSAFRGCESLVTVTFPKVTNIGDSAFSSCPALRSLSIPKVGMIWDYVFSHSSGVDLTITMGRTAPAFYEGHMFDEVTASKTVTVVVPTGATDYDDSWIGTFSESYDGAEGATVTVNIVEATD
jgi:hypothetical protein